MNEVSLDSIDLADDRYGQFHKPCQTQVEFHGQIFKNDYLVSKLSNRDIKPMNSVSGKVGVKYEWGDKDKDGVSAYAKGSASDNGGNQVEIEIRVENDGSGSVSVEASHEENDDNSK